MQRRVEAWWVVGSKAGAAAGGLVACRRRGLGASRQDGQVVLDKEG